MPIDSTADLLFRIGADAGEGTSEIQAFRALLGKDLSDLSGEFGDWATKVFGDLSTVKGALTAMAATGAAAIVAIGAAAVECAHKYSEYVEEVERGSRATGISIENMSGLHLMAEETGVSYDSLVRGLTRFASVIVKASDGGEGQMKMFHALGISQEQVKAGEKDMIPLLELVMDRFHKMGPSVLSSAAAREAFGRGAIDLARFLGMGGEALQHYIEKTKELGIQLHATDVDAVETFNATMKVTKSEMSALALEIGKQVLPVITDFMIGAVAAGVALKNLPKAMHGAGAFAAAFGIDMAKIGAEVRALRDNMSRLKGEGPMFDAPEVEKVKEEFGGISTVLDEIMSKQADLAGPVARAAEEGAKLRDRLDEARQKLEDLHKESKVSGPDYEMQLQDLRIAAVLLPQLTADMTKKAGDAVAAAVAETGAQLRAELLKQGPQTLAVKLAEWDAETAARRAKIVEQGKRDATDETANLALLDQVYAAGVKKLWDDAGREALKGNADLAAKVAAAAGQNHATKVAALEREVADMTASYEKEGNLTAENEALIAEYKRAGLAKIAAEERAAYDSEMARLGEQLERIDREHQTAAQRIVAQYEADAAKWSAAEERKTLATATGEAERARISAEFAAIRTGLYQKEQADLQQLANSQGWQHVFGAPFAEMIRGNEALTKEWQTSGNQSAMLVRVTLEGLKEAGQQTFQKLDEGLASNIAHMLVYEKSGKAAMEAMVKSTLESLSAQALSWSIAALAWGFWELAHQNPVGADAAFTSAALWGSVGAAAGIAGRAVPGGGAGGSGGSGGAGNGAGASGRGGGADYTQNGESGTAAGMGGPHVTVNIQGHVFGTSGVAEVANLLSDAVMQGGATLTATNTTTGVQVQK